MDTLPGNQSSPRLFSNASEVDTGFNAALVVQVFFMVILDLVAICGNASVIFIIVRTPQLRSLSHLFVLNLCFVDLLAAVLVLPVSITTVILGRWVFGDTFCHANGFLNALCAFTSISTLGVISIDRYFSIAKPMVYAAKMTLPRVVISIACIWIHSAAFSLAPLLGWNEFSFNPNRAHCSFTWDTEGYHIVYIAMVGVLCFALPAAIIISMYCGVFRVARKAARQVGPLPAVRVDQAPAPAAEKADSEGRSKRGVRFSEEGVHQATSSASHVPKTKAPSSFSGEIKALKTLLLIVGMFLVLWSPYFILHVCGIIYKQIDSQYTWERVTSWIAYASFAVNPYVYGWLNKLLRQELIKAITNCRRCRATNSPSDAEEPSGGAEDFYQFLERTSTRTTSVYTKSTDAGRELSVVPGTVLDVSDRESC